LADLFIRGPRYKSAALITIGCCHAVCHGLAGLADADDGGEPGAPGGFHLLPDQRVALAMIGWVSIIDKLPLPLSVTVTEP
jgi:hypothetical protein